MSKRVCTDTGSATLREDSSLYLNNSGYVKILNKDQLEAVWDGASVIPHSPRSIAQLKHDGFEGQELADQIAKGVAVQEERYGYWDFGDEMHEIPAPAAFVSNDWIHENTLT